MISTLLVEYSAYVRGVLAGLLLAMLLVGVLLVRHDARRTSAVLAVVAAAVTSAMVEAVQAVVPATGRVCDTNDWFMNTVGTVLGVLLAVGTLTVVRSRHRDRASPGSPDLGDPASDARLPSGR